MNFLKFQNGRRPPTSGRLTAAAVCFGLLGIPHVFGADPTPPMPSTAPTTAPVEVVVSAERRLEIANAGLMAARAAASRDYQNRPDYMAALKAVQTTFNDFHDKRNAVIDDVEKKDKRIDTEKGTAAAADAAIKDACQPNSTATPEQIEELFKKRETAVQSWQTIEADAVERAGLAPARKAWADASAVLAGLSEREADEVEKSDAVKAALAAVKAAESEWNGVRPVQSVQVDPVDDYLRKYPRAGINKAVRDFDIPTASPTK